MITSEQTIFMLIKLLRPCDYVSKKPRRRFWWKELIMQHRDTNNFYQLHFYGGDVCIEQPLKEHYVADREIQDAYQAWLAQQILTP